MSLALKQAGKPDEFSRAVALLGGYRSSSQLLQGFRQRCSIAPTSNALMERSNAVAQALFFLIGAYIVAIVTNPLLDRSLLCHAQIFAVSLIFHIGICIARPLLCIVFVFGETQRLLPIFSIGCVRTPRHNQPEGRSS
jgi:hypothetical protein